MEEAFDRWEQQKQAVKDAYERHKGEFGLRAYPGKRFSLTEAACFWSELENCPMLYTYILNDDGVWRSFAKGTEKELIREKVAL